MSKIPYRFKAIPDEFLTDEFIEDPIMMRIIREIMNRIRHSPHQETFRNNRKIQTVYLEAYEFLYGRDAWEEKLRIGPTELRNRINQLLSLNFIFKSEKTTSTYTVFRLNINSFSQNLSNNYDQQNDQQSDQQSDHKEEALASSPNGSNLCAEEEQQQTRRPAVVVAIEEGWKYLRDSIKDLSDSVCYVVLDPREDTQTVAKMVRTLHILGLSDEDIYQLRDKYEFPVERILLAIEYVQSGIKIHTTIMATIVSHCQKKTPWPPRKKKSKSKQIDLVEASKKELLVPKTRAPQWMLDANPDLKKAQIN